MDFTVPFSVPACTESFACLATFELLDGDGSQPPRCVTKALPNRTEPPVVLNVTWSSALLTWPWEGGASTFLVYRAVMADGGRQVDDMVMHPSELLDMYADGEIFRALVRGLNASTSYVFAISHNDVMFSYVINQLLCSVSHKLTKPH